MTPYAILGAGSAGSGAAKRARLERAIEDFGEERDHVLSRLGEHTSSS